MYPICREEAKCIKNIVSTISRRLSPTITNLNKDLVGIETRLQDLRSKLELKAGGVRMVGIWGVGGGGKTTLANAAYTKISHQFEACCLLESIRVQSSQHGLKKLQEIFLSNVLKKKVELVNEIQGKIMIKQRLCHKRVLVVLDDVNEFKQLEALVGSHDWFGDGSRIIITTRDEHLLTRKVDVIYEVNLLSRDEALTLFGRHAYQDDRRIEDYEKLSLDVVSYAGGLPLALEILGSFLYDKDKDEWQSLLAKLKRIPDHKVTESLKISYDGLDHHEKELFLDIACFMRRWPIDHAMRVLDACTFHSAIGVKVLVQKSLIKVSNGILDMHDLIEEMAHHIVRNEHPNNPENYSRIWHQEDIEEFCAMETPTLTENHHIEVIALPNYISDPSSPPRVGKYLEECDVLEGFYSLQQSPLPNYVEHQRLPDVVANMKKLRWILWAGYPASSLPTNFQPIKLGCLMMLHGQQKRLWKGCKHLPNLKILNLRGSERLIRTPDFSGLPCLERLILKGCRKLKKIHPSIGYHERLVFVDMNWCVNLKTFPPIIRMKKLETLDLCFCFRLKRFPDIRTNMESLVNLHLDRTKIDIVPSSIGIFCTNLVSLHLRCCDNLKRIEVNFCDLKCLKDLNLFGCSVEKYSNSESNASYKSGDSTPFKNLLNRIGLLSYPQDNSLSLKFLQFTPFLRKLNLKLCNLGDGDIPSYITELLNLEVLHLGGNSFSRLHSSLSRIPRLKFLSLSYCSKLVELPDLPSSLTTLEANHCIKLESGGDLSIYKRLWKVSLCNDNMLIDRERVLHSMLQKSVLEDRFMSVALRPDRLVEDCIVTMMTQLQHYLQLCDRDTALEAPNTMISRWNGTMKFTLKLPHNWYNDFSGFLLCDVDFRYELMDEHKYKYVIVIGHKKYKTSEPDHWEEFDNNSESYNYTRVGYVPFDSMRHTSWWNSTHTEISFKTKGMYEPKVGLVPRISKGDSITREKGRTACVAFSDEPDEPRKTFEIIDDSKSSKVKILWTHKELGS